jgi:hypothetical protein
MIPCELVTTATAVGCAIANCVTKEELPLLAAFFSQLSATLATITVEVEAKNKQNEDIIPPNPPVDIIEE